MVCRHNFYNFDHMIYRRMKNLCVIFNCHGEQYIKQLLSSKQFSDTYNISYITNYEMIEPFSVHEILIMVKADVKIMQYIKDDNLPYHHSICQKLSKKGCINIVIPCYTFSGYHPDYSLINDQEFDVSCDKNVLIDYINNLQINTDIINRTLQKSLDEIKQHDNNSSIKMYDFVKDNYRGHRLFQSRSYPTYIFFGHAAIQIAKILGITDKLSLINTNFAHNLKFPIFPCVVKHLDLKFEEVYEYAKFRYDITDYFIAAKKMGLMYDSFWHNPKFFENLIKIILAREMIGNSLNK